MAEPSATPVNDPHLILKSVSNFLYLLYLSVVIGVVWLVQRAWFGYGDVKAEAEAEADSRAQLV